MTYTTSDQSWAIARLGGHILQQIKRDVMCLRCNRMGWGAWVFNYNCEGERDMEGMSEKQRVQVEHEPPYAHDPPLPHGALPLTDEDIERGPNFPRIPDIYDRLSRAYARIAQDRAEIQQLTVQLAGCSVAAFGGTADPVVAVQGQYGWSVAYQDVLECRRALDTARAEIARLTAERDQLRRLCQDFFLQGDICPWCNTKPHIAECDAAALARLDTK